MFLRYHRYRKRNRSFFFFFLNLSTYFSATLDLSQMRCRRDRQEGGVCPWKFDFIFYYIIFFLLYSFRKSLWAIRSACLGHNINIYIHIFFALYIVTAMISLFYRRSHSDKIWRTKTGHGANHRFDPPGQCENSHSQPSHSYDLLLSLTCAFSLNFNLALYYIFWVGGFS